MTKATKTRILLALTAACTVLPSGVDAAYRGDTDTGFQHLDFIHTKRIVAVYLILSAIVMLIMKVVYIGA